MIFFYVYLVLIGLCKPPRILAQQHHSEQTQFRLGNSAQKLPLIDASFDKYVESLLEELHVPGLSLAIIDDGQTLSKGYGIARFPSTPATPDTLYFAGSTTKAFTAAAAALMVQNVDDFPGLEWSSPVSQFIREDFVLDSDYATTHITIEDALSHRSGLPRHDLAYGWAGDTPSSIVKLMRYLPLTAEPRTAFQYCNLMFVAITDVLETLTGLRLDTVFRDKFWGPLGMRSTSFSLKSALDYADSSPSNVLARGYYWVDGQNAHDKRSISKPSPKGYYVPEAYLNLSSIAGAGATISTVNDYALWIKAFLDAANSTKPANQSSPITRSLYESVLEPRTIISESGAGQGPNGFLRPATYALGWVTISLFRHTVIAHDGGLPGFGANVYFLPDEGYGVVTMGNTALTSNLVGALIALELIGRRLGVTEEERASTAAGQSALPEMLRFQGPRTSQPDFAARKSARLPLPGKVSSYTGIYANNGYGNFNITLAENSTRDMYFHRHGGLRETESPMADSGRVIFHGQPQIRLWKFDLFLHHESGQFFTIEFFLPHGNVADDPVKTDHGCSGQYCVDEVVWQEAGIGGAAFKYGLTGEVEKLGMELEGEMVEAAMRNSREKNWEDGMIWFEKIG